MNIFSFSGLLNHYGGGHYDYTDTNMALSKVRNIIMKLSSKLKESVIESDVASLYQNIIFSYK